MAKNTKESDGSCIMGFIYFVVIIMVAKHWTIIKICIFILIFIYIISLITKINGKRKKYNKKENSTPQYLIEEWRKNDEEIKEGKKKDKIGCKIDEEKTKGKMSDEEALKYAIYCNAYMEHKDEMRKYGIEEE